MENILMEILVLILILLKYILILLIGMYAGVMYANNYQAGDEQTPPGLFILLRSTMCTMRNSTSGLNRGGGEIPSPIDDIGLEIGGDKKKIPINTITGQTSAKFKDKLGINGIAPEQCGRPNCPSQATIHGDFVHDPARKKWDLKMSKMARRTKNSILELTHNFKAHPNINKEVINICTGDPCFYGNLVCPKELTSAMIDVINSDEYNGYSPSYGHHEARSAVAKYLEKFGTKFKSDDIILFNGSIGAIENTFLVLAQKGDNVLIPKPGFSMYQMLADCYGIIVKHYNLLADQNWEVDIDYLESQVDSKTKAILINNPSNSCGSVYTAGHLTDIINVASKHRTPIISDEICERLVFPGKEFVSTVSIKSDVPIFLIGGISQIFLVPGYRIGWVALHDPIGGLDSGIKNGLKALSSRILGPNTLVQGAIVKCIYKIPQQFVEDYCNTLHENATLVYNKLNRVPGLTAFKSEGSFYTMVQIEQKNFPDFKDTMDIAVKLMEEQSVHCLPGDVFNIPFCLRLTISVPAEKLEKACERMETFFINYYKEF